jgi:hypothetical protein
MIKNTVCYSSMPITVQASLRVRKLALHSNRSYGYAFRSSAALNGVAVDPSGVNEIMRKYLFNHGVDKRRQRSTAEARFTDQVRIVHLVRNASLPHFHQRTYFANNYQREHSITRCYVVNADSYVHMVTIHA